MSKAKVRHRSISSSQNCAQCDQVMRKIEKARTMTSGQAGHYALNREIIDERTQTELLGWQLELARQGGLFEE